MNKALFDKRSTVQILGGLMKKPEYIDEYGVVDSDFEVETFYRIIFAAINNLYRQGVKVIDSFAIDSFLSSYQEQYQIFTENRGVDYCSQATMISELDNFEYYLGVVKKFSLLRFLEDQGYDVKRIYDWTATSTARQEEETRKLDAMSSEDIINFVESQVILSSKIRFSLGDNRKSALIGSGLHELKESFKESPEYGLPLQSKILTTISRGCRLRKLYLRSSASGGGKSRTALADFCNLSVPWFYDTDKVQWVHTGFSEPSLFISTELELDELQTIAIAYVSGVNESHILDGRYEKGEEERVDKAIEYINSAPLHIEFLPNFSLRDIETLIKKHVRDNGVRYVCFDYVHESARMMSEISQAAGGGKLRGDQMLFLVVDAFKNLCNQLGIFLLTMSQLNGNYQQAKYKDENLLRGAKSMADRIDLGEISLPPIQRDLEEIASILHKRVGMPTPNMVRHVYKLRRGKMSKVKIWQYADLGTSRTEDLFVTDFDNVLLPISPAEVEYVDEEIDRIVDQVSVDSSSIVPIEEDPEFHNGDDSDEGLFTLTFNW